MKKILAIFMALVVFSSFAFFAIGSSDDSSPSTPNDSVTTDDTTTAAPVKKISRGTLSGNVYTNEFVGFSFTKPADWTFATDEELKATMDAGAEYTNYSDLELTLSESATVYDMQASDSMGNSVMVLYENTMLSAFKKMTEDEYFESLKSALQNVNGITYTLKGTNNVTLGDETFKKATFSASANGATIDQYYYVKAFDKYVVSVIVTTTTRDISAIEEMFS